MKTRSALAAAVSLALLLANPVHAEERSVTVEGAAPATGDLARARRAAIGDALRQALAAGGMDMEARTLVDRGVIQTDRLWATARGRITDYQVTHEWRDGPLYRVALTANVAPLERANSCVAAPPPLHLGLIRADIDPAIDPAIADPLLHGWGEVLRLSFAADPTDAQTGALPRPLAASFRSSDRYAAMVYGHVPGTGIYLQPYLRLRARAVAGLGLVRGQRMEAVFGIELIDAADGAVMGRRERAGEWTLAARNWEYLPADYRPARRAVAPDVRAMVTALIKDVRDFARCQPVSIAVSGRQGGELFLTGGADAGLRVGDLLRVGEPTESVADGLDWPLAEVVSVADGTARARLFDAENDVRGGNIVVRLR